MTDHLKLQGIDHIELYSTDATTVRDRLQSALGLSFVAKADLTTGCKACTSFVLQSEAAKVVITAPGSCASAASGDAMPLPGFHAEAAFDFVKTHGIAVHALGMRVPDAAEAYATATARGAVPVLLPTHLPDAATGTEAVVAAIRMDPMSDAVLRFVSGSFPGPFLPGYHATDEARGDVVAPPSTFGIRRMDHVGLSAQDEQRVTAHLRHITSMHPIELDVVETKTSSLAVDALSNDTGTVLLNISEPKGANASRSPMQRFLDHHRGDGVQHIALEVSDIFAAVRAMRKLRGGLGFMPRPSPAYYRELPARVGDAMTAEQIAAAEETGVLADRVGDGTLLQIFTGALGDRPTFFFEIIQRLGCMERVPAPSATAAVDVPHSARTAPSSVSSDGGAVAAPGTPPEPEQVGTRLVQRPGCGGFGNGNIKELYTCMEQYDARLRV